MENPTEPAKDKRTKVVTISLSESQYAKFQAAADREDRSLSRQIARLAEIGYDLTVEKRARYSLSNDAGT